MVQCNSSKKQIWVFGDRRNLRLLRLSCYVLGKVRQLATELNYDLIFILFKGTMSDTDADEPGGNCISVKEASKNAVEHGADYIFCFVNNACILPQAHIIALGLTEAIKVFQPALCLFAPTDFGRELAARTAAAGKMGIMADCAKIALEKKRLIGLCPTRGGSIIAKITFSDTCKTGLATVQPHGKRYRPAKGQPGTCHYKSLNIPRLTTKLRLVSREVEPACQCKLEEAKAVVVGGLGLSSPLGFEMLKTLAAALGGEVAATRPPVLNGWLPEERMLGQTGKSVRPELLISVGTSGAVQYTAGIVESQFIVAINRDPNAPIFQVADIGVIADATGFLPLFIEKVKRKSMRSPADQWCGMVKNTKVGNLETFGEKLYRLRNSHQWSYETLAEATGRSPDFLKKAEKNIILPPINFLLRLASIFGVSPDTFLNKRHQCSMCQDSMTQKC